jgi:F-type H+-transporting ATPase subunit b
MSKTRIFALLTAILTLLVATIAFASDDGHAAEFKSGEFIAGIINFAIFVFILIKFGGKPISAFFKERADTQMAAVKEAELILAEARGLYEDVKKRKDRLNDESERIVQGARDRAEQQSKEILEAAKNSADRLLEDAKQTVTIELAEAKAKLSEQLVEQAIGIARNTVSTKLDDSGRSRMVDEFVAKMEGIS